MKKLLAVKPSPWKASDIAHLMAFYAFLLIAFAVLKISMIAYADVGQAIYENAYREYRSQGEVLSAAHAGAQETTRSVRLLICATATAIWGAEVIVWCIWGSRERQRKLPQTAPAERAKRASLRQALLGCSGMVLILMLLTTALCFIILSY